MSVIDANAEIFEKEIAEGGAVVVDFYADWCGPCRMLKPIFEKISVNYEGAVKFLKINVDNASEIASKYAVSTIPTVIFFKNGSATDRFMGAMPEKGIAEFIEKNK